MPKSAAPQIQAHSFGLVKVGDEWHSDPVKVTEEALQEFSKLSGDFNLLHADEEYAKRSIFHRRVAHGHLTVALASGFWSMLFSGKTLAMIEANYKFVAPVFIGDTIRTHVRVTERKPSSKYDGGIVKLLVRIVTRADNTVVDGTVTLLLSN